MRTKSFICSHVVHATNEVVAKIGRGVAFTDGGLPRQIVQSRRGLIECSDATRVHRGETNKLLGVGAETLLRHERHWQVIRQSSDGGGVSCQLLIQQLLQCRIEVSVHHVTLTSRERVESTRSPT